ncbi:hypothetical protein [Nocardia iowensis]|uniref:Uncharacterized protein n=1 Tax=Nocardia iowensis TaxID=204891 RepID=A0ABX8S1U7_NOCIO|nr:hypothetical protein [Nocardia iowensis]QXN94595.1 hypothetical protein KV110_17010 [Nocardia iowensis]
MHTPTRLQTLLLNGIQNLAHDNWIRVSKSVAAGHDTPPLEVAEQITMNKRTLAQLEELASLVGCPHSWLHYARTAGDRGQPSNPQRSFYSPEEVPRPTLITALAQQIHDLQDSAGVLAAHTLRHHDLDRDERTRFQAVMGVVWQRLGAVSHELGVTDRERDQMWSRHGSRHWANIVAHELNGHGDEQLSARFHAIANADFSEAATPLVVMLQSGITVHDIATQMPHSAERMVELVDVALDATPRDGLSVNDAVAATTLRQHPATEHVRDESAWGEAELDAAPRVRDYGAEP